MATSIISTVVSSTSVMVEEDVGVVMVVVREGKMSFLVVLVLPLYVFGCSIGHRM